MRRLLTQLFASKNDRPDLLRDEIERATMRNNEAASQLESTMRSLLDRHDGAHLPTVHRG